MIIGDMEIRLRADIARLQRDMDQARQVVSSTMANIDKYVGYAKAAFVSFIGIASVSAFAGMIKGSIEATAGLHDMSIQTGASVAGLMALRSVAATSDTTIQDITGSMNKMAKNMAVANEESKGTGQAIKALGLDFNTLKGLAPDRQMLEVAKALDKFQDGAGKSAVAMSLYGKEGAKMLPFLKDLADESDAVTAKLSEQQMASKAAQAAMADDFSDNLTKIKKAGEAWKKDISMGMLPALYEASQAFIEVTGGAGGFKEMISKLAADGSITRWARMAVTGLTYLMDALQIAGRVAEAVGKGIGAQLSASINMVSGMSSAMMKFAKGDWSDAWNEVKSTVSATANIGKNFMSDVGDIFGEQTFGSKMRESLKALQGVGAAAKETKAALNFDANPENDKAAQKEAAAREAAANKEAAAYLGVAVALKEKIAGYQVEIDGGKQLTEMQKARIKFDQELAEGKVVLSEAHVLEIRQMLDSASAQERYIAYSKAYTTQMKARTDAQDEAYRAAVKEADANEALVATFGMSKKAIEAEELARLENQLAQKATLGLMASEIAELERLIEVKKRNSAAVSTLDDLETRRDADKKMSDEMLAEQQKSVDKYNDIFSKGFADMLNNGKAGWSSFTKSLTTTFKTSVADQIYKMFAQPFVVKMVASLLGVTGSGAATAAQVVGGAGDVASGVGSIANLLSTAKSGYTAITNGIAETLTGGLNQLGATITSNVAALGEWMGGSIGNALSSNALAIGNAGIWAGGIGAGLGAGKLISNGYSVAGNSGNGAVMVGTALGAIWGPLGSALGGAIGGLVNRAFGMGAKTVTGTSLQGTLGTEGFSGQNIDTWTQKGGWLRSDKSGTTPRPVDDATSKALSAAYADVISATAGYAEMLGENGDAIRARTDAITVALGKDDAANQKAMAQYFTDLTTQIVQEVVPGLDYFSKAGETTTQTFERLAQQYFSLDGIFAAMGTNSEKAFGLVGVASLTARERLINLTGSIEIFTNQAAYFNQNFLTAAEQLAPIQDQVTKRLAELGYAGLRTTEDFKKAVLGLQTGGQLATEQGAATYAGLLALAPAFKAVADAAAEAKAASDAQAAAQEAAAKAAADALAATNKGYQDQIDQIIAARQGEAAVRALEIKGLDATTVSLYDYLHALQTQDKATAQAAADAEAAANKAKASADALAATNASFDAQIAKLLAARQGEAALRALEIQDMDATTVARYDYLNALKAEDKAVADATTARAAQGAALAKLNEDAAAANAQAAQKQVAEQQALADQRAALETKLYNLTHTEAEQLERARRLEIAAMDSTLVPLQQQIDAQQDLASAAAKAANEIQAAAQKAAAIASEGAGIQRDVLQLKGDTAGLRALELAALDPANRAAKQAYFDLQDKMAADQAASAAAQAWASAQAQAAQASAQAAKALKDAWQSATDSIFDEVARIRNLVSTGGQQSLAGAESAFAIATAQARANDQDAAKSLPALSKALLDIAEQVAPSLLDLQRIQARTLASLQETGLGLSGKYGLSVPSYDVGTNYVPRTGLALIHEGEKITPAAYNNPFTAPDDVGGTSQAELLAELRELRRAVERLEEPTERTARSTTRQADLLEVVTEGGDAMRTKEEA